MRLCWLGHPRVELSGSQVRLETRKTIALLAYLSMNEYPQSREKLAAFLWPEYDQTRAPANLRRTLASLHASAPGDWLEAERDTIRLKSDSGLFVDVLDARRLAAEIKAHSHAPDEPCRECLERATEAITLFTGEFLEGFNLPDCPDFDDWQMTERESLKIEQGWLLERSALGFAAAERWEDSLRAARLWVRLDKMHEPAQALLVRLLALCGRRSAAIRQYEDYAEALRDEFGQEPEKGTQQLYNLILSREIGPKVSVQTGDPREPAGRKQTPEPSAGEHDAASGGTAAPGGREVDSAAAGLPGLLATKLSIPPVREGTVKRERLVELLQQGLSTGLVVVSAPAGFGKTTILSELAAGSDLPVAWVSLDDGDNDPQRFLVHLSAALETTGEGVGGEAAQMLRAVPPPPPEVVMTKLVNAVQHHSGGLVLIFDDYQLIRAPQVHTMLRFMVDHRPASLAFVVASRADPPFPLARLRSQRGVVEIRAAELRFNDMEARQFFDGTMSLALTNDQVAVLERRTEGWAAGLQMAALSLQGREDVDQFIASFGGTHRFILDYLAEEVLSRQEEELKQFLLDTSILTRMSAALCEAVTGMSGCEEMLDRLERMNLFLVPLDEERRWYRYHHLFRDLLRHRLQAERSHEEIAELHVRAADWLAREGEVVEAVQEYLTAKAHERAACLIEERYFEMISRGALGRLQAWCSEIPAEIQDRRPGFRVACAWALTWVGRGKEAAALLDLVEGGRRAESSKTAAAPASTDSAGEAVEGSASAMRALIADMAGDTARSVELARKAQSLLPPEDFVTKSFVFYILEKSHYYAGELEEAERGCRELFEASHATGSIFSIGAAVCELARLRGLQGRRRDGLALLEEFDALAVRRRVRASSPVAKVYAILSEFKRERGDLEEALSIAKEAAANVDAWGLPSDVYITHQYLARVLRSCGQTEQALAEIRKVEALPSRALVWAMLVPSFEADRVKTYIALGDVASAEAWVREYGPGSADNVVNRELELTSLARVRVAARRSGAEAAGTLHLLDELARSARNGGRNGPLIAILVLEARAKLSAMKDLKGALASLEEALVLAEPEGYLLTFLEEGPEIASLLEEGKKVGMWASPPLADYVSRLLSAFNRLR